MKLHSKTCAHDSFSPSSHRSRLDPRFYQIHRSILTGCSLAALATVAAFSGSALAVPAAPTVQTAQALPTPLPPLPSTTGAAVNSGEQFLVLVSGSSDLLLQQVRQVEPGAFVNYIGGQSVIQAGRFSSYQNAQVRASELANFGIGAEVQATDFAGAPIAVTSPDFALSFPPPLTTSPTVSQLPSSPVAATPASIEFGQAAPFQSAVPTTASAFPPAAPVASINATPPPLTTSPIINQPMASGYYVVVPGNAAELPNIANRILALGAPNSLVATRTAPRGPHVAVGPYEDRGIAQEWTNYLRDAGVSGARVHFE